MKVFGLFYGGSGYGLPDVYSRDDVEEFFSIDEAKNSLIDRRFDPFYPCVEAVPPEDGGMYMHLFREDPYENPDPIPDYLLEFNKWGYVNKVKL